MPSLTFKLAPTGAPAPDARTLAVSVSAAGVLLTIGGAGGTELRIQLDGVTVATVAPGTTSYLVVTAPGIEHAYRVVSFDAATGKSSSSNVVRATRPRHDAPTGLAASASQTGIRITASASTYGGTLTVDRPDPDVDSVVDVAPGVALNFLDTETDPGATTTYRYTVNDADGHDSEAATVIATRPVTVDTTAPATPTNVTAAYVGAAVLISFTANAEPDWNGNKIERRQAGASAWTQVVARATAPYTDAVDPDLGWDYRLSSYDDAGNTNGAFATAQVRPVIVPPPQPPVGVLGTYYVRTTGVDTNNGTTPATAFRTIQKGVNVAQPGDVVYVFNGTYTEAVTPPRSGTASKPIILRGESEAGVILDGNETLAYALDLRNRPFWRAERLTVRRYFSGFAPHECAIRMGADCTLSDVTSTLHVGGAVGFPSGAHRTKCYRVKANDNGLDGIQGTRSNDTYFEDCEASRNNFGHVLNAARAAAQPNNYKQTNGKWHKSPGNEASKFSRVRRQTFVRHTARDNNGWGLWHDIDNRDIVLTDCDIDFYVQEIGPGPLTITGGRGHIGIWESGRWSTDGGATWNVSRWSVTGHTFDQLSGGINAGFAMELRQGNRVVNVDIHDAPGVVMQFEFGPGDITNCQITAGGPLHTDGEIFHTVKPVAMGMVIDRNTYRARTGDTIVFWGRYADGRWNLAKCRANGIEQNGRVTG